jgi:hypothetical protein
MPIRLQLYNVKDGDERIVEGYHALPLDGGSSYGASAHVGKVDQILLVGDGLSNSARPNEARQPHGQRPPLHCCWRPKSRPRAPVAHRAEGGGF